MPAAPARRYTVTMPVKARWPLAVAVVAVLSTTAYVGWLSTGPDEQIDAGLDFLSVVWGPLRGVRLGLDPYDPASAEYLQATGVHLFGSVHAPSLLTVLWPLGGLDASTAFLVWSALSGAMMWAAAWLLVRPDGPRPATWTIGLGLLLTVVGAGEYAARLGQVTSFAVLGLALAVRFRGRWPAAVGVACMLVSPQIGVPMSILALADRRTPDVVRGWLLTLVLSLPVLWVVVPAAGGVPAFAAGVARNISWLSGEVNAANRVDLPGVLGLGAAWTFAALAVVVAAAVAWHRSGLAADEVAVLAAASLSVAAVYAMPYSLTLVLAAAAPVLVVARRWGLVERLAAGLAVLTALQTIAVLGVVAPAIGANVPGLFRLIAGVEGLLLVAIVIAAVVRLRSRAIAELPDPAPAGTVSSPAV